MNEIKILMSVRSEIVHKMWPWLQQFPGSASSHPFYCFLLYFHILLFSHWTHDLLLSKRQSAANGRLPQYTLKYDFIIFQYVGQLIFIFDQLPLCCSCSYYSNSCYQVFSLSHSIDLSPALIFNTLWPTVHLDKLLVKGQRSLRPHKSSLCT